MTRMVGATMSRHAMSERRHIKTRERVPDLGKVYTQPREVDTMHTEAGVIDVGSITDAIQKLRSFAMKSIESLVGADPGAP